MESDQQLSDFHLNDEKEPEVLRAFIQFCMGGSHYALDINDVSEVVEIPAITLYPEVIPGHVGVVNLSGQVLPVVDFTGEDAKIALTHQLLVVDFTGDRPFGLIIENPRRVELAEKTLTSSIININSLPVRILHSCDFNSKENES